ncbi:MAG: hypothetical protein PWQ57_2902 [Desulfovibrionales bacterium]|jgi:hypothetical protein|nr:hypothetical protein [Desulfovibrionales bacterium]
MVKIIPNASPLSCILFGALKDIAVLSHKAGLIVEWMQQ